MCVTDQYSTQAKALYGNTNGGRMTENIDKVGGAGTGIFAKEVIEIYISSN